MAQATIEAAPVLHTTRPSLIHRLSHNRWVLRLVVWGGLVLVWHLLAVWKGPFFLATPLQTLNGLAKLQSEGHYPTVVNSLGQLGIGFGLAVAVGVPLGLVMGSVRAVDDVFAPFVNTLFVTPKEALLPFLIALFGTQLNFRIAVVFLFAIFFIVINSAAGVRAVSPHLIETARAFRMPRHRVFTRVVMPASTAYVVAGIRLGLGMAIKGMVIAEIWVTIGIGLLLNNFGAFRQLDLFLALAAVVVAIGVASTTLLSALERRLRTWAEAP